MRYIHEFLPVKAYELNSNVNRYRFAFKKMFENNVFDLAGFKFMYLQVSDVYFKTTFKFEQDN